MVRTELRVVDATGEAGRGGGRAVGWMVVKGMKGTEWVSLFVPPVICWFPDSCGDGGSRLAELYE